MGIIHSIEPEDIEAIEYTYFDCWSPTGDETSPQYDWEDTRAIKVAEELFQRWEKELKVSLMPEYPFEMWWLAVGWEGAFQIAAYRIAQAGFNVYLSDTRMEIYKSTEKEGE